MLMIQTHPPTQLQEILNQQNLIYHAYPGHCLLTHISNCQNKPMTGESECY